MLVERISRHDGKMDITDGPHPAPIGSQEVAAPLWLATKVIAVRPLRQERASMKRIVITPMALGTFVTRGTRRVGRALPQTLAKLPVQYFPVHRTALTKSCTITMASVPQVALTDIRAAHLAMVSSQYPRPISVYCLQLRARRRTIFLRLQSRSVHRAHSRRLHEQAWSLSKG
jgi:hypothetical protein